MSASRRIRVLLVDDSAFARKVVREALSMHPSIEVAGSARDGEEALELTASLKPDVVICDLSMPRLDGLGYVRRQMARQPVPILILSAAAREADEVLDALSAGALGVVRKPSALATDELRSVGDSLIECIEAAVTVPLANLHAEEAPRARLPAARHASRVGIVVLGISTGGPQALRLLLPRFPPDFPVPILIVLHMPVGYTAAYAEKLNEICALEVREAAEGDALRPGYALIAPAGRHLTVRQSTTGESVVHLSYQPLDKIHRPSVDVLFRSAAEVFGKRALAVVMTGMGDDGKEGAGVVKARGGTVLTEAEKSCVIYGMPRSVIEAGLSDDAVLLNDMAQAITSRL